MDGGGGRLHDRDPARGAHRGCALTEVFRESDGVTFVIASVGRRDAFVTGEIIPRIRALRIPRCEIVVTGRFAGPGADRVVSLPEWPAYFYKPLHAGVRAASHPWVITLDDDMTPTPGFWTALRAGVGDGGHDEYGFAVERPDGAIFGGVFFPTYIPDRWLEVLRYRTDTTRDAYFGWSMLHREVALAHPYPPYMSGDREYGLVLGRAGVSRLFLPAVGVVNHGVTGGGLGQSAAAEYAQTLALRRRLGFEMGSRDPAGRAGMMAWFDYAARVERPRKRLAVAEGFFAPGGIDAPETRRLLARHEVATADADFVARSDRFDLLLIGVGSSMARRLDARDLRRIRCPIVVRADGPGTSPHDDALFERAYVVGVPDAAAGKAFAARYPSIPAEILPDPALPSADEPARAAVSRFFRLYVDREIA